MKNYDPVKIGKKIARGTDRTVYMYGDTQVIKFSFLSLLSGKPVRRKMIHDYALCKQYFGDYVVDTIDISTSDDKRYIELQQYIGGERFCKKHALLSSLKIQLKDINSINNKLIEDGHYPIDLVGHAGMWSMCLSNLLVDEENNLKIIDATLLEAKSAGLLGLIIHPFLVFPRMRQRNILKRFLQP